MQNSPVCAVVKAPKSTHITPILKSLPVAQPTGGHRGPGPPPKRSKKSHNRTFLRIQGLLPRFVDTISFDDLREALDLYKSDLGPESVIAGEFELWKLKWTAVAMSDRPLTAAEAMEQCDTLLFPQIRILLQLFLTLPLTSATAERSFSTMRRLKSYL